MKLLRSCVVLIVLFWAGTANAQTIVGSDHDFKGKGWNGTGEICAPCHVPHDANTSVSNAPLWNHAVTTQTFTVYNSGTITATMGQPDGTSKLCLSCHDGTVALDSFGGATGSNTIGNGENLGTSMANDHPVSFTFDTALASSDGGLHDPSVTNSGLGGTINADMLFSGKVECATCHDVHNGSGVTKLLVISNASSALCLTCHDK